MGDIIILFFIQNILIFSLVFWLLVAAGNLFAKKKENYNKKKFYECGFKAISDINIQININFALICVFLVLYDVEFLFFYPLLFNLELLNIYTFFIFFLFLNLVLVSLYYDLKMNALNWQY